MLPKFYIDEGQEEVDKALMIKDKCLSLKKVIWEDPKRMRYYNDPILINYEEVHKMGRQYEKEQPGAFEEMISQN